ncbi:neprilysin-1-like, partial [Paramuricea clavata]
MDTSVKPCDDFYQYSCGGFVKQNYIPDDENSLQSFNLVGIEVQNHLRGLLEDNGLKKNHSEFPNSAVSKAFNFYSSCMNISHIEKAGQVPIGKLVENFGSSPMLQENWTQTNWNLERTLGRVMGNLGLGVLVALDVSTSLFNTSHRSLG